MRTYTRRSSHLLVALASLALVLAGCANDDDSAQGDGAAPAVAGVQAAAAQGPDAAPVGSGVTVTGTGRVSGEPDVLTATIGAEVQRPDAQAALDAASASAGDIIAALKDAGVADEDIQTRDVAIEPRRDHSDEGRGAIVGYDARNLVEVRIRDLDNAGGILDTAVEAGGDAARMFGLSFSLEDNEELLTAAREAAFGDARTKAEQYAQLSGRTLGELVGVSEVRSAAPQPQFMADAAREDSAAAVPIETGSQEVSVEVTAVWSLD